MSSQNAARQAATKRALQAVDKSEAGDERHVWNFGFGANINPAKLRDRRGIRPAETARAKVEGFRLLFNHRGGFGNIEEVADHAPPTSLSPAISHPSEVHGVLLRLSHHDFGRLAGMGEQPCVCVVPGFFIV